MPNPARVEALLKRMESDTALTSQLTAAPNEVEKRALLDRSGFNDVQMDDVKQYLLQTNPALTELNEEALAQIAGGELDATDTVKATVVTGAAVAAAAG